MTTLGPIKVVVEIGQGPVSYRTYKELEVRESAGEKWLAYAGGAESMPLEQVPHAIENNGWHPVAGGMGCPQEFISPIELERVLEVVKLMELRDLLTDGLEEIGMFDKGRAGDLACAVLKDAGAWSTKVGRVDGQPEKFFDHRAHRGSDVAEWIKNYRDHWGEPGVDRGWLALDRLLDDYRLHADTGTSLAERVSEGGDPA